VFAREQGTPGQRRTGGVADLKQASGDRSEPVSFGSRRAGERGRELDELADGFALRGVPQQLSRQGAGGLRCARSHGPPHLLDLQPESSGGEQISGEHVVAAGSEARTAPEQLGEGCGVCLAATMVTGPSGPVHVMRPLPTTAFSRSRT